MKYIFLVACLFSGANVMAQNNDTRNVEFGMEWISELQATVKDNYHSVMSGDVCRSTNYANYLRLNASVPISNSLTIEAASISTCMTASESIGGDLQIFSNLDAGDIPLALSLCDVAITLNENNSLFLGIRTMNEDYFCCDITSLFTNSSCGIYPTISANYPIANYPVASVGVHYKYEKENDGRSLVLQGSLYNGMGYNRFTGRDNVFRFCPKDDGLFGLVEAQYHRGGSSYFLGACGRGEFGDDGSFNTSLWTYGEQHLTERTSLIAGYSHAFGDDAVCTDFVGIGGRYAWERCALGIFTDYARFVENDEFATELTCKVALTPHLYLQPSLHAIFMPHDAELFHGAGTVRLGVTF